MVSASTSLSRPQNDRSFFLGLPISHDCIAAVLQTPTKTFLRNCEIFIENAPAMLEKATKSEPHLRVIVKFPTGCPGGSTKAVPRIRYFVLFPKLCISVEERAELVRYLVRASASDE
mmetsp:Transcript_4805/g.11688  ORF Transcript_4805/g.11688 Transcript_4805/m.11688 type:complete len:117 (+) Transcript_4805:91-441(+)